MTNQQIIEQLGETLNAAWSGSPSPEKQATFYLGVCEGIHACMQKLSSGAPEVDFTDFQRMCLDKASEAVKEHRRHRQLPWYCKLIKFA